MNEPQIMKTIDSFELGFNTYYLDKMEDKTYQISKDEYVLECDLDEDFATKRFDQFKKKYT